MTDQSFSTLNRLTIAFFGRRNAGKSRLMNAVTAQDVSIVSDVKGTTTDPVKKTMELLPLGPVTVIDTPGIDDEGDLGALRVQKTLRVLQTCDIAVLVVDSTLGFSAADTQLESLLSEKRIPYVIAFTKSDLLDAVPDSHDNCVYVSAASALNVGLLKERISALRPSGSERFFVRDLIHPGDFVVLVIPIDSSAPKGRLILPQQLAIRDILEAGAVPLCCGVDNLLPTISALAKPPALVITDSQAFAAVSAALPAGQPLTSFSILMARMKGFLNQAVRGAFALDSLQDGDTVLVSEGCTHHRQCEDIGTVKLPAWCRSHTKRSLLFEFTSGGGFPDDVSRFALIIHCGACMLNDNEVRRRMELCAAFGTPVTNYGTAIAHMNGILSRSLEPLRFAQTQEVL